MRIAISRTSRADRASPAIALLACGLLACAACEAASVANGHNLNGSSLNGVNLNGVSVNGVSINGISINAVGINGAGLTARARSSGAVEPRPASAVDRVDCTRTLDVNRLRVLGAALVPPASATRGGS